MGRLEQTSPHRLRDQPGIAPIRLDGRGLGEGFHLADLNAVNGQATFGQAAIEPWCKRSCFQSDADDGPCQAGKAFANVLGMAGNGALNDDIAGIVDDTNGGLFQ
jgi:hypothetical protein